MLLGLLIIAILASIGFARRSYNSYLLLQTATELGQPQIGAIRPWMTLEYVATAFHASRPVLIERLGLAADTRIDASLRLLARQAGVATLEYIQRVQRAVAATTTPPPAAVVESTGAPWINKLGEDLLAAVIVYGYPALGLIALLGAAGLPLPTGLATVVAGSLSAAGQLSLAWAAVVALSASVLGDVAGYWAGRLLSREFLARRARWLGFSAAGNGHVDGLFVRWGGLSVVLTRTLASHLSALLNLVAGAARYRVDYFLLFAIVGRLLWTGAYLSLGYAAGSDLEAASGFLANVSLLLICLALVLVTGVALVRGRRTSLVGSDQSGAADGDSGP